MATDGVTHSSLSVSATLNLIKDHPETYGENISKIAHAIISEESIDLEGVANLRSLLSKRLACMAPFEAPFKTGVDDKSMVLNEIGLHAIGEIRDALDQLNEFLKSSSLA